MEGSRHAGTQLRIIWESDMCMITKIVWVFIFLFLTPGAYAGGDFGGSQNPGRVTVRGRGCLSLVEGTVNPQGKTRCWWRIAAHSSIPDKLVPSLKTFLPLDGS